MSVTLRFAFGAVLLLAAPLPAQTPVARAAETIKSADLFRDVSVLASDAFAGRATPSAGYDSAAAFVAKQLKALGIKPMGDNGTYFQHYPLVRATLDTTRSMAMSGSSHWMWGSDFLVTSFVTAGTRTGGVVYVGHGIRSAKLGLDPYAGLDLKGKWVIAHGRSLPAGVTRAQLGALGVDHTTVLEEARARGALGIITVPSTALLNGWEVSRRRAPSGRDLRETVGRAYAPYPLPQVLVSRSIIVRLFSGATTTAESVLSADSTGSFPASIALDPSRPLQIDLVAASADTVMPYNVVGFVEGSDPVLKNEWVIIGSHLDGSVGRGANPAGDSIFNAADDNATGSAGNMAIARALMAGPRPKRSVLMVWDSGEETGLWGSRFLAYGPLAKQAVTYINVDMIGRTKAPGSAVQGEQELSAPGEVYVVGPGLMSTVHERILGEVVSNYKYATVNRRYEDANHEFFYPRTDASPYMENGIPSIQFFTGLHGDYHRQTDEVIKLDPIKMENAARMAYVTLWMVANSTERPRFDKPVPAKLWFVTPR